MITELLRDILGLQYICDSANIEIIAIHKEKTKDEGTVTKVSQ